MGEEGLESETVEKINELLEFLKKEKVERKREEEVKHDDFMYYAFLYGFLGTIISIMLLCGWKMSSSNFNVILSIIFFPSLILIILFSLFRFFGIVLEDDVWRYISLHGLLIYLIIYLSFMLIFLISILPLVYLIEIKKIANIWQFLFMIGICTLFPFLFVFRIGKINNFIKNKLHKTKKYKSIKRLYKEDLDELFLSLGMCFLFLFQMLILPILIYCSEESLSTIYYIAILGLELVIICFFLHYIFEFYAIKNKTSFPIT